MTPRQIPGMARLMPLTPELLAHYSDSTTEAEEAPMIYVNQDDAEVRVVTSQRDLEHLRADLGLRPDWHEPDERGVTAEYAPGEFDNAMALPGVEAGVWVLQHGVKIAYVNLALLFAFGTGRHTGTGA